MPTIKQVNSNTSTVLPVLGKVGTNHYNHDGKCPDPSCTVKPLHNHRTEYGCLGCIKDYLEKLIPFEQKIKNIKGLGDFGRQFSLMVSNLTPAIFVSEILKPFHVTPFVASPLAISAMHLTNRGNGELHKLLFTSLSSVGVIGLQKFLNLPRVLIRPIMALAVFFIERNGNKNDINVDLAKLLKLQGQINTVPWLVNLFTDKLKETNENNTSIVAKFLGHVGVTAFQIISLSLGFLGLGHLIDKLFVHFKVRGEDSLTTRTESAVCACCGAPVCVAEVASEVGSMSVVG